MIYFLVLAYTLILVFKYDITGQKRGFKANYYILLVTVCCVSGVSYRLGMDTVGYMVFYKSVDPDTSYVIKHLSEYRYEPVFMIFLSLCKSISDDFTIVQFLITIFVNSTIFWFLRKHSPLFFVAILFYFVMQFWNINFEIKRESITISLFLIAIDGLLKSNASKREYIRYYLICSFMLLCHRFAFVTFFYPLFTKIKLNKTSLSILVFLCFLSIANIKFATSLFSKINILSSFVDVQGAVTYYMQSDKYGNGGASIFGVLTSIFIPLFMLYKTERYINSKVVGMTICYLLIQILTTQVFILYRFSNYLCFFVFILFSYFTKYAFKQRLKINRFVYLSTVVFIFLLTVKGKFNKDQYIRYYPYTSVFDKKYNQDRESEYYKLSDGDSSNIGF